MNIIQVRQEIRRKQINQIKESIKKAEDRDFKHVVMATMSALNLSRRTAREYVEVAFFELENEIR